MVCVVRCPVQELELGMCRKLIKAFEEGDYLSMEELGEITSLEASKLSSNLTLLELNGRICKRSDGRFEAL